MSDPTFRAVAESARRAVDRCSPLQLPPDKYSLWRDIVMSFYPEDAVSG
jgi:colicin import membrane protein